MTAPHAAGVVGNDSGNQPESAGSIPARRSLRAAPITLAEANRFVEVVHRHNGYLPAAKFAIAALNNETGEIHGVAIAGRPKARLIDDGYTLEINRVCTDGTFNCCSFLYARCIRAAKALGYGRCVTYTLTRESGASLRASGWNATQLGDGGSWLRVNSPQRNKVPERHDLGGKVRWDIELSAPLPSLIWPDALRATQPPALFDERGVNPTESRGSDR